VVAVSVPFVHRVRGTVRGVLFVSDGSALVPADRVIALPDPAGVREIPAEGLASLLELAAGARATPLASLTKSLTCAGAFCTTDDVAIQEKYVWLFGSLGRDLTLYTTGPSSPIVVAQGRQVLGTVMPVVPPAGTSPTAAASAAMASTAMAGTASTDGTRTFTLVEVADAAQHLGLLGELDHGSWARLASKAIGRHVERLTEAELRDVLLVARAAHPGARHTGGRLAERESLFVLDASGAEREREAVIESVRALARSHGVEDVAWDGSLEIRAIHAALGRAFARSGSRQRVHLVGDRAPFVLIRERLAPTGPFSPVHAFEGETAPPPALDVDAFLGAFGAAIAGPNARVERLESLEVAGGPEAPPHTVHVLRRSALSGGAESFFLVTSGLCRRPLANATPRTLGLVELTTWTSRYDERLASTLSRIGVTMHALASAGARLERGQAIGGDEQGFLGWPSVLLSQFGPAIPTTLGRVDVARVTPITNEEWASKQRLGLDVLGGEAFVRGLESRGIPALLGRWYAPPTR
jgi:hypothetical protein